jgi:hypothetical protein
MPSQWIAFLSCFSLLSVLSSGIREASGEEPTTQPIQPATYTDADSSTDWSLKQPVQTGAPTERAREVEMIRQLARHRGGQPAALAQIIQLTRTFEDAVAAEIIDELAVSHFRAGNLNLAAESRTFLTERFPSEPLGRQAALWLVRLYASSEVAHAHREETQGVKNLRRQLVPEVANAMKTAPATIDSESKTAASQLPKQGDPLATYALHLATQSMSRDAALAEDPALAFQRAAAARRAGQEQASQAFLSPLSHRRADDPWGQCARAEAWLQESQQDEAPKPTAPCTATNQPPHLDGILNDPCWQAATASRGVPAPGAPLTSEPIATDVRWAHDSTHLYIALQCHKAPGVDYAPDPRPRPRDGDVESHDRVRLLIDLDRDYASWFELVVDSRGWTADGCWGDPAWNPAWYVARGESTDGASWTIEAAIPLAELTTTPPTAGAAWACAIERLPPKTGRTEPTGSTVRQPGPAEFSLLLFE